MLRGIVGCLRMNSRLFAVLWLLVAVAGARTLAQERGPDVPKPAPRSSQAKPARVHVVQVNGDLDNADVARLIGEEIAAANEAGAGLVMLALDGHRWRMDVVANIAAAIGSSSAPVAVLLRDAKDHRVGAGEAALGLCAASCWIDPKTSIRSASGDDRRELAPKAIDLEKALRDVVGAAAVGQKARGADARLPGVLIAARAGMIAQKPESGGAWLLAPAPAGESTPVAGAVVVVEAGNAGGPAAIVISARIAVDLRIARGVAAQAGEVISGENIVGRPVVTKTIASGLAEAATALERGIEHLDRTLDAAERALVIDPKDKRKNTDPLYHQAGRTALDLAHQAGDELDAAEKSTRRFPELLRQAAYGQTDIGRKPSDHEAEWRRVFQKRRDRIAKLEVKARAHLAK